MKIVQLSAGLIAAGLFIAGPAMAQSTSQDKPMKTQTAQKQHTGGGGGGGGTDNPVAGGGAMKQHTAGGGGGGTDNPISGGGYYPENNGGAVKNK